MTAAGGLRPAEKNSGPLTPLSLGCEPLPNWRTDRGAPSGRNHLGAPGMRSECHLANSSPTPRPHDPHSPFFPSLCFLLLQQHLCNLSRGHHRLVRPPASQHSDTPPPHSQPSSLPTNAIQAHKKGKGERKRETERGWLATKNNLCRLGLIALQREKQVLHPQVFHLFVSHHTGQDVPSAKKNKKRHGCWGGRYQYDILSLIDKSKKQNPNFFSA